MNYLRNGFSQSLFFTARLSNAAAVNNGWKIVQSNFHTQASPLLFQATSFCHAEPLKKQRRMDPAVLKFREDKKVRRVKIQIQQLKKHELKLKPIEELMPHMKIMNRLIERTRPKVVLMEAELDRRALLHKDWSRYKYRQHITEQAKLFVMMRAQQKALLKLREVSEHLYQCAMAVDWSVVPFEVTGPTNTPPIHNFQTLDGDYTDTTKKWDGSDEKETIV